jgi:hypothetical protein
MENEGPDRKIEAQPKQESGNEAMYEDGNDADKANITEKRERAKGGFKGVPEMGQHEYSHGQLANAAT